MGRRCRFHIPRYSAAAATSGGWLSVGAQTKQITARCAPKARAALLPSLILHAIHKDHYINEPVIGIVEGARAIPERKVNPDTNRVEVNN